MTKEKIMAMIDSLARSQGFYGRLGRDIREAEKRGVDTAPWFAQFKNYKDEVDVILMIEG